ncbi:MAG: four helix bundle protein [Candidatus Udaeobacter sp.]
MEVWQRGCRLSVAIFGAFEKCKRFTLRDQIERAGLSIPSNIAEGAEQGTNKDFAHFLNFSKGSCGELRTQLYIARKLNELEKNSFDFLIQESREISAMLQGLRTSMLRKSAAMEKLTHRKPLKT